MSRLPQYNEAAKKHAPTAQRFAGLVISLHGMNARGTWQKHLSPVLQEASLKHEPYDFGWCLLEPFLKWRRGPRVEHFLLNYERAITEFGGPVSVIAHSYGSLIFGTLLDTRPALRFNRAILFGSILPRNYDWQDRMSRKQIRRVLNEASRADLWAWVAPVIPGAGHSGCRGFLECPGVTNIVRPKVGHSDLHYRTHYRKVWVPFIKRGKLPIG